jgi:large subunit ribosomal protein L21
LVQFLAVPKPDISASAVVVSGGKQYRVAPGDRILVDRLTAEPGSSVKLGRVVLFSDGDAFKVGREADGLDVEAKVIAHRRGPRIESLRYKSKKRVRVHTGGRAHLTALEIIAVGGIGLPVEEAEVEETSKSKRGRAKAEPKPKVAPKAKAEAVEPAKTAQVEATPKRTTRRRTKKETE